MRIHTLLCWTILSACPGVVPARGEPPVAGALRGVPLAEAAAFLEREAQLAAIPNVGRLAEWHAAFTREVHPAGSDADRRMAEQLAEAFSSLGLSVERQALDILLPRLVSAQVDVCTAEGEITLPLSERPIPQDPAVRESAPPGWNAWSGSGAAEGEVVYAHRGLKADFERLEALGIPVRGRIVVARYGGSFRGMKAHWAERAGAAGLLLFTDPADDGYGRGLPYPEGGYANETSIQRGAVVALNWPGDVLTPGCAASAEAARLDPAALPLPGIPVQPLGWAAALEILSRMRGHEVPEGWQGGLPLRYRVEGGPELRVRMRVEQPREIVRVENVVGILRGARFPEQMVVVGCHYDAWTHGAGDPHAGSIVLYEMARAFAERARAGVPPDRTVVFANWAAEEFGIIGSTEWVEARRDELQAHGVAYLNLDMAAMGPDFSCSASPLLQGVIEESLALVPQARDAQGRSVADVLGAAGGLKFGDLGGGSDHVAFQAHAGVPSFSLGAGGSRGVSYHTAYDTLAWYRATVGDYEPALMLARVGARVVHRLANAALIPYSPERYAAALGRHGESLLSRAKELQRTALLSAQDAASWSEWGRPQAQLAILRLREGLDAGRLDAGQQARLNRHLLALERTWLHAAGLPGRPWWKSLYGAPDPDSGYVAWMLPGVRLALERGDEVQMRESRAALQQALRRLQDELQALAHAAQAP